MTSLIAVLAVAFAAPPEVGAKAPEFALSALDGSKVTLSEELKTGPVVLVVLRGYPGYQCPLCTQQVREFASRAKDFEAAKARVVLVYPAGSSEVASRAKEFLGSKKLPKPLVLTTDPDFAFLQAYGLRWDAPGETSYPSSFVINQDGTVKYAKVSKSHGGRAPASDLIKALRAGR